MMVTMPTDNDTPDPLLDPLACWSRGYAAALQNTGNPLYVDQVAQIAKQYGGVHVRPEKPQEPTK